VIDSTQRNVLMDCVVVTRFVAGLHDDFLF